MVTTRHGPSVCPLCGYRVDAAGGAAFGPGDVLVCISCSSVLVFTEGLSLRVITTADFRELDAQERALALRALVRQAQAAMRRDPR